MSYQQNIGAVVQQVLDNMEVSGPGDLSELVEVPKDRKMGDFSFPCFRFAKIMRQSPAKIAGDLFSQVEALLPQYPDLASVEATGPYLNFRVNRAALAGRLIPEVLSGNYLAPRESQSVKVMIEYSQPNTHKAFHVGHTRNLALGDALVRIFEWTGHEVVAANYIGDEGAHVAKCLWYYKNYFDGEIPDTNLGEFLGDLYTKAVTLLDFETLTACPMLSVTVETVKEVHAIPDQEKVKRVVLDTTEGVRTVVCGGTDYAEGDRVAYAALGARVNGRRVDRVEKHGVSSEGMILSGKELGLNGDKDKIYTFPSDTEQGLAVAEYFRIEDALPADASVVEEMQRRTKGVADMLHLLEAQEGEAHQLWQKTKNWSMDEFYKIYDWFGARFDHYFFEAEVGDAGKKICQDYYEQGVLEKSEGAVGANLDAYKLPFFLLIKSDGSGLYSTKDIALAKEKFDKFQIDRSIYVVDVSQSLHFQQVFRTLEKMGYDRARNCYHLAYGMVRLPDGKMSSRTGNVILFSELKEQLRSKITAEYLEKYRGEWPEEEIEEAAKRLAIATIRYGMVNHDNAKDLVFDMGEWISATGNTGPYMMYAYARVSSIKRKAGEVDFSLTDWNLLTHDSEHVLLDHIKAFGKTAERACSEYRPQVMCIYLFQLAKDLSRFYESCPVLKAENPALRATRLQLVDAVGQVLKAGLGLLGIQTLERM